MQFDLLRAFPYPVLRPSVNDYIDGDMQANVSLQEIDGQIVADVEFALSISELRELIDDDQASFAVVFACRDTYFRRSILSKTPQFNEVFSAGALRGEVLIYPYVLAVEDIQNFSCRWINPEFGDGPFDFPSGAALALDTPQTVYIDRESFRPLSSCFTLVKSDDIPPNEWRVHADGHRVQIVVSPSLKQGIDAARNSKEHRAILMNSLYFGAVLQCISILKHDEDDDQWRWQRIFRQRMESEAIDIDKHNEVYIAQQLLRHPIATLDQYYFSEKSE